MDETRHEKGVAGTTGTGFQVDVLTLMNLNAPQRFKNWRLSTENKLAGKFDDAVLEWPGGAYCIQLKHKTNKKNITRDALLSTHSKNDDFSLPKYFVSCLEKESKFEGNTTLIICTNADIQEKALGFLDSRRISRESVLYYGNDDYFFYTLSKTFLEEFKEHAREYLKNKRNKNVKEEEITEKNIEDFMDRLQIFTNFPSDDDLKIIIEKLWAARKQRSDIYENIFARDLHSKVKDWFEQPEGIYLTEILTKAIFSEIRTEKYWETLEGYGIELQHNDLQFSDSKRIRHVIAKKGYLLQAIKTHGMLRNAKIKFLSISPDDNIEVQREVVEAFQLKQYTHLIIIWPRGTKKSVIIEVTDKLSATLMTHKYKKIVLVTETSNKWKIWFGLSKDYLEISFGSVEFNDLSDRSREKLLNKRNIVFQGRNISLKELLRDSGDLEKVADLLLQKLVRDEKVTVGAPLLNIDQSLTHLYINRIFKKDTEKTNGEKRKVLYSEEEICDVPGKIILIADTAGTGKSTVLTNLATVIKEKSPWLWVIKIESNDFSAALRDSSKNKRETMSVLDLLQSKHITSSTNDLDNFVFAMEKKVVLMLDGMDEVSPDYTDLVLNLLVQCREGTNFAKVFVTARPHAVPELQRKLHASLFKLELFTEENQIYFLTDYWTNYLNLREDTDKRKCEKYARALTNKMSLTDLNNGVKVYYAAIPLHLRMLAEIFQASVVSGGPPDWEGCAEYINANEEDSRLPEKMDIMKLYKMYFNKKRDIYMEKENPNGNVRANLALRREFAECFPFYGHLALKIVLTEKERQLSPFWHLQRHRNYRLEDRTGSKVR